MAEANNDGKLVHMANQIAAAFQPYPEERAVASVVAHINAYWTPKMRAALTRLGGQNGTALHPLVRASLPALR